MKNKDKNKVLEFNRPEQENVKPKIMNKIEIEINPKKVIKLEGFLTTQFDPMLGTFQVSKFDNEELENLKEDIIFTREDVLYMRTINKEMYIYLKEVK